MFAVLLGCATPVRVVPLATGRADAAAFRLFGADLPDLQDQALNLCPEGFQTWQAHQSGTPKAAAVVFGSPKLGESVVAWQRAIGQTQASAQMLIVCRQTPMAAVAAGQLAQIARVPTPVAALPAALSGAEAGHNGLAPVAVAVAASAAMPGQSQTPTALPTVLPKGRGEPATAPVTGYDR